VPGFLQPSFVRQRSPLSLLLSLLAEYSADQRQVREPGSLKLVCLSVCLSIAVWCLPCRCECRAHGFGQTTQNLLLLCMAATVPPAHNSWFSPSGMHTAAGSVQKAWTVHASMAGYLPRTISVHTVYISVGQYSIRNARQRQSLRAILLCFRQ